MIGWPLENEVHSEICCSVGLLMIQLRKTCLVNVLRVLWIISEEANDELLIAEINKK